MKAVLVLHTSRQLKEDNGKQNAERYGVRKGSPVGVQWAVRLVIVAPFAILCTKR